jgi:hypothetical protein
MKQRTIILGAIGLSLLLASCAAANDPRPTLLASPIAGNRPTTDEQPIAATSTAAASPAPSHAPTTAGELPSPAATPTGSTTPALTMKLELPATVQSGQSVQLKFIMTNTSTQPVEVYLGGRPAHDFVVSAQDGSEVWRWSHDQTVQAILEITTLAPGEQREFTAEWPLVDNAGTAVPAGTYLVQGILNGDPPERWETERQQLTIVVP